MFIISSTKPLRLSGTDKLFLSGLPGFHPDGLVIMKQCQFPAPGAQRLLSKCNWKSSVLSFLIVPPTLLFCQSQVPKISHASGPPPQSFPPLKDIGVSDRGDSLGVVCKLVCLRQFSLCSPRRFDFPVLGLQMGSVSGGLACTFLWAKARAGTSWLVQCLLGWYLPTPFYSWERRCGGD